MPNKIFLLRLYRHEGLWCFDAPEFGLVTEPFVQGADRLIDAVRDRDVPDVERPLLMFSEHGVVGSVSLSLVCREDREDGPWHEYHCRELGLSGWLCPALLSFFEEAPEKIYARLANWPDITAPFTVLDSSVGEPSERSVEMSL